MLVQTGQEEKTEAAEAAEQTVMETDKEEVVDQPLPKFGEEELVKQILLETDKEEVVEKTLKEIGEVELVVQTLLETDMEEVAVVTGPRDQENVGTVARLGISVQSVSRKKAVRSTAWLV